nr:hypothetical protein [Arthrospira sp. PLM2.Bin9]
MPQNTFRGSHVMRFHLGDQKGHPKPLAACQMRPIAIDKMTRQSW